jgi:acyl dehydratase
MDAESTTMRFATLIQLKEKVGQEIGVSKWLQIEQKNINAFAEATLDYQWIHTDPELAKLHSSYGTTVAHGFMILSLLPKFLYEVLHIDEAMMGVNYGLDKVRFPKQVPVDSYIRARVTLSSFESISDGAKMTFSLLIEIKDQEKPACIADFLVLIITAENENL